MFAKPLVIVSRQFQGCSFKRVDTGSFWISCCESFQSGGFYKSELLQLFNVLYIHQAPVAPWFSRRKPIRVAGLIDTFANAVNPPEAKCLTHRFRIRDGGFSGIFFVKADPEFRNCRVVLGQPFAKLSGRFEVAWIHNQNRVALAPGPQR